MGREQRENEAMKRARWERTVGDVRPFGTYAGACPKCGTSNPPAVNWCPGAQVLDEESGPCPIMGQHLHTQCAACSFVHLTRTLDDDETPPEVRLRVNPSAALAAVILRLVEEVASGEHPHIDLPVSEIEAASRHRIGASVHDGVVRVVAVAP